MNFTTTVPTALGSYWWRKDKLSTPIIATVKQKVDHTLWVSRLGWYDVRLSDSCGERGEWGPRIEPPQPVPGDVMEAVNWLREIATQEAFLGAWSEKTKSAVLRLCNYIDPPKELPLPRRFRGKYMGHPVVGDEYPDGQRHFMWRLVNGAYLYGSDKPKTRWGDFEITEWIDGEQP